MKATDGVQYDDKGHPVLLTPRGNLYDYDLNIFHVDEEDVVVDEATDFNLVNTKHKDKWYVDIYEYVVEDGASNQYHVAGPFELRDDERLKLGLDDPKSEWGDDAWYGMWGFLRDYKDAGLWRLYQLFGTLPKYKEEVLF